MTYYHININQRHGDSGWTWRVIREATVSDTQSIVAAGRTPEVTEAVVMAEKARDSIIDGKPCDGMISCPNVSMCAFCGREE